MTLIIPCLFLLSSIYISKLRIISNPRYHYLYPSYTLYKAVVMTIIIYNRSFRTDTLIPAGGKY